MVEKTASPFLVKGEKIALYLMERGVLHTPVRVLDINENTFSSCLIMPKGQTFCLSDILEEQVHQLSTLYDEREAVGEVNYAWWKLCYYWDGQRLVTDCYYHSLPASEGSSCTMGQLLSGQMERLNSFSFCRGESLFVSGRYAVALPLLYQLQEVLGCTLLLPEKMSAMGHETARIAYIPATWQSLQAMTHWGMMLNDLIPGQHSIEENCLLPTYASGNCHFILLKIWWESDYQQNLYICTEHTDTTTQKTLLWKH